MQLFELDRISPIILWNGLKRVVHVDWLCPSLLNCCCFRIIITVVATLVVASSCYKVHSLDVVVESSLSWSHVFFPLPQVASCSCGTWATIDVWVLTTDICMLWLVCPCNGNSWRCILLGSSWWVWWSYLFVSSLDILDPLIQLPATDAVNDLSLVIGCSCDFSLSLAWMIHIDKPFFRRGTSTSH